MFLLISAGPAAVFVVPVVNSSIPSLGWVPLPSPADTSTSSQTEPPTRYGRLYRLLNQPSRN
jgi:hypothetical protein